MTAINLLKPNIIALHLKFHKVNSGYNNLNHRKQNDETIVFWYRIPLHTIR